MTEISLEDKPKTPIEEATMRLIMDGRQGIQHSCGVGARPCKGIAVAQVGCCCKTLHYGVNTCEKHIATAVKTVTTGGCEVEVSRIFTGGVDQKLFEGRRDKSRKLTAYGSFLQELLVLLAENGKVPTTDDHPEPQEHLKAVVRYAYADLLRDKIERFRNSLNQSTNP